MARRFRGQEDLLEELLHQHFPAAAATAARLRPSASRSLAAPEALATSHLGYFDRRPGAASDWWLLNQHCAQLCWALAASTAADGSGVSLRPLYRDMVAYGQLWPRTLAAAAALFAVAPDEPPPTDDGLVLRLHALSTLQCLWVDVVQLHLPPAARAKATAAPLPPAAVASCVAQALQCFTQTLQWHGHQRALRGASHVAAEAPLWSAVVTQALHFVCLALPLLRDAAVCDVLHAYASELLLFRCAAAHDAAAFSALSARIDVTLALLFEAVPSCRRLALALARDEDASLGQRVVAWVQQLMERVVAAAEAVQAPHAAATSAASSSSPSQSSGSSVASASRPGRWAAPSLRASGLSRRSVTAAIDASPSLRHTAASVSSSATTVRLHHAAPVRRGARTVTMPTEARRPTGTDANANADADDGAAADDWDRASRASDSLDVSAASAASAASAGAAASGRATGRLFAALLAT
eukprot:gene16589-11865_t